MRAQAYEHLVDIQKKPYDRLPPQHRKRRSGSTRQRDRVENPHKKVRAEVREEKVGRKKKYLLIEIYGPWYVQENYFKMLISPPAKRFVRINSRKFRTFREHSPQANPYSTQYSVSPNFFHK